MQPLPSDRHISTPLTNMSIAYAQDQSEYVARRVFPVIGVDKQFDRYYEYSLADFLRSQMVKRAPATESVGGRYRLSSNPYTCDVFALHRDIPDQERANADDVFNLDEEATNFLTTQALLKEEIDFASHYMNSGIWGTSITGVASAPGAGQTLQWSDGASTPIEDIDAAKSVMKLGTGQRGNVLVITEPVWVAIKNHPDFLDRIKGGATAGSPAIVLRSLLASLLELDEVLVMGGIQNTADEGQTAITSFIGGKSALLVHRPRSSGRMIASAGYTFAWRGYLGGTSASAISRFRMDLIKSDRIEIESAYVQQVTGASLGYFWGSIVA